MCLALDAIAFVQGWEKGQMRFQIIWTASSKRLGEVNGTEEVDADSSREALQTIRSPIIAKLNHGGPFKVLTLDIKNQDGPTTINLQQVYEILNSLNAEGGLVKYEP